MTQTLNENWGACDLVLIVYELHQRGYEQLRLFGGMSPNGMAWRWNIYPKCLMDKPEYEWYDDCPPFECPHGSAGCPKSDVDYKKAADVLLDNNRALFEKGKRPDKNYARWFKQLAEHALRGDFPVAFGEYFSNRRNWKFFPSEEPLKLPPFRPSKIETIRYDRRYQKIAEDFVRRYSNGEWIGAKYLGHYYSPMCDADPEHWLAFEPFKKGYEWEQEKTGVYFYIFINEKELVLFKTLYTLLGKKILWEQALDSYYERIVLPPKQPRDRFPKNYITAITTELTKSTTKED